LSIIGPGAVSYTPALEVVAERRVLNDWGLTDDWSTFEVLAAVPDCRLLNRSGWLIAGGKVLTVKIVDCAQEKHRQAMVDNGLLADASMEELNHKAGWLVLR